MSYTSSKIKTSWQAHCLSVLICLIIRRQKWGNEQKLARRARRVFRTSWLLRWLQSWDVDFMPIQEGGVKGEWVVPKKEKQGVILYIHGGAYVSCSSTTHRPITAALARLSGYRVFSLDYRLAPEHRFPAALDDVVLAYQWLLKQELQANHLCLVGDSAGGGLVFSTVLSLRDKDLPIPACAVCFSPWTDLAGTGASIKTNDGHCAMFRSGNIAEFAAVYLDKASPFNPKASPLYATLNGLPPFLIQVSSTELLLDDSTRIHHKILEVGGSSRLEVFNDLFHCWQMMIGVVPEAKLAFQQAVVFICDHLRNT